MQIVDHLTSAGKEYNKAQDVSICACLFSLHSFTMCNRQLYYKMLRCSSNTQVSRSASGGEAANVRNAVLVQHSNA